MHCSSKSLYATELLDQLKQRKALMIRSVTTDSQTANDRDREGGVSALPRLLLLFLAIGASALFGAGCDGHQEDVAAAKAWVEAHLKDPSSVQYRNVRRVPDKNGYPRVMICGEMNAKNSYGGYVGFRRFYWYGSAPNGDLDLFQQVENAENQSLFDLNYKLFCEP